MTATLLQETLEGRAAFRLDAQLSPTRHSMAVPHRDPAVPTSESWRGLVTPIMPPFVRVPALVISVS